MLSPDRCIDYDYDVDQHQRAVLSPGSDKFAQYEEYLGRELPRQVRRRLEDAIDEEMEPIEERLKAQLVDIVKESQADLFRTFQANLSSEVGVPGKTISEPLLGEASSTLTQDRNANLQDPLRFSDDLTDLAAFYPTTPVVNDQIFATPIAPSSLATNSLHTDGYVTNPSDSGYGSSDFGIQGAFNNYNYNFPYQPELYWDSFEFSVLDSTLARPQAPAVDTRELGQINIRRDEEILNDLPCNCKGKGKEKPGEHKCE